MTHSKKQNRKKGHDFERWVAGEFGVKRNIETQEGWVDVYVPHYFGIQCKYGVKPLLRPALKSAEEAMEGFKEVPIAVCRDTSPPQSNQDAFVVMRWSTFFQMYDQVRKYRHALTVIRSQQRRRTDVK